MKTLLKNGKIVDVFAEKIEKADVLIDNGKIIGVGYFDGVLDAQIIDASGKFICPSFIDGHIHIESTMLLPYELAKLSIIHGTTAIVADPHEIANVCGKDGIRFMLEASKNLPFDVYFTLPSCVPATSFDESKGELNADDLREFYSDERVVGLAEMMNYVGAINGDEEILKKIADAKNAGKVVNGHAPLLSGKDLEKYISLGITDDHECSSISEATEKLAKGMHVMIRQGTAARNLEALLPLFNSPYHERCMLVTDDKHPEDLIAGGHIDHIIRLAVKMGASVINAIKMASIIPAEYFNIKNVGAIKEGYRADLLVLDSLEDIRINCVYKNGEIVAQGGKVFEFTPPIVDDKLYSAIKGSFKVAPLSIDDFIVQPKSNKVRVIKTIKNQLLTEELITELDFKSTNGIDTQRDIIKIAVIERHNNTGHKSVGFISGLSLKKGAIATSVSHDSHNLICVGASESDMAQACNRIIEMGGGLVVVLDGMILAEMPLTIAGLTSENDAYTVAKQNKALRDSVYALGVEKDVEPFMTTAFISLSVIPHIKITTLGLIDVDRQKIVDLFV